MKMNYSNVKAIDAEKLRELLIPELNKRLKDFSDLSRDAGYASSFFSNCMRRGSLNKPAIGYLEREYGIKYEQYALNMGKSELVEEKLGTTSTTIDTTEILAKLDEVNNSIKELANIQLRLLALMEKRTLKPIAREKENE